MKYLRLISGQVVVLLFLMQTAVSLSAQPSITFNFKGTQFSWQSPQNWNPAGPPGPDDIAIIPLTINGVYDFDLGVNAYPPTLWYPASETRDLICNGTTTWYPWGTEGLIVHREIIIGKDAPAMFSWLGDLYVDGPVIWDSAFGFSYDNGTLMAQKISIGPGNFNGIFRIGHLRSFVITDTLVCGQKGLMDFETAGNLIIHKRLDVEGDLDLGNLQLDLRGSGHVSGNLNSTLYSKLRLGKESLTVDGSLNFGNLDQLYFSLVPGYGQIVAGGFGILNNCVINIDTAVDGLHKIISSVGGFMNVTIGQIPPGTDPSQFSILYQGNSEVWILVTGLPVGTHPVGAETQSVFQPENQSFRCNSCPAGRIRVFTLQAQCICDIRFNRTETRIPDLKPGIYFLEYPTDQGPVLKKIVIP